MALTVRSRSGAVADSLRSVRRPEMAGELVIDSKSGLVRQAGADQPEGRFVLDIKQQCERSLYAFCKFVLKQDLLTPALHGWACKFLQQIPPYRKLLLMPRGCYKTTMVSQGLPIHLLIQPKEANVYIPNLDGAETRILLSGETQPLISSRLRWIETQYETNDLLKAFWPHRVWGNPRRDSKKWNEVEMIVPRGRDYPDPSIRAIGVGGAITGAHVDVEIKDDLISIEAANSPAAMQTAKEWHIASRALLSPNEDTGLEFTIGTRWAVADLYEDMMHDPTVEHRVRSIVEDGQPILPEQYTMEQIDDLRRSEGVMFYLWRMNSIANPELTDFHDQDLRYFTFNDGNLIFDEDGRDVGIKERAAGPKPLATQSLRGQVMTPDVRDMIFEGRQNYLRLKR